MSKSASPLLGPSSPSPLLRRQSTLSPDAKSNPFSVDARAQQEYCNPTPLAPNPKP